MRSTWLVLGMLIPLVVTLAVWQHDAAATPRSHSLFAGDGAKVVTGDVGALLATRAPSASPAPERALPAWLVRLGEWLPEPPPSAPLLVVLVDGPERVAVARRGVDDDDVAAESPGAFVVGEDRMVAASRQAASEMLMQLDWLDRPLHLFSVEASTPARVARTRRRGATAARAGGDIAGEVARVRASDQQRVERAIAVLR